MLNLCNGTLSASEHSLFKTCGHKGSLETFLTLIQVIVASRYSGPKAKACTRVPSPKSSADIDRMLTEDEFDFIVVGGGTAGVVIAARLVADPNVRVLLIEAGGEEPKTTFIPALASDAVNSEVDWKFKTAPQKNAFKSNGGISSWPCGKMLCGTACLSGLMYTRGSPSIYNAWAEDNPGWSYEEVMKYFKKSEHNEEPRGYIDKEYHGFDGPLKIGRFPHLPRLGTAIIKGVQELGYRVADVNGRNKEAFTVAAFMVNNGERASPRAQYLDPVLDRKNLTVLIECYVTKILFDKSGKRAQGVEFVDKWNKTHQFKATKEVVLSAGTMGSPQILMMSGVGPKTDLTKLGIKVVRDLPVGANLHNHVGITLPVRLRNNDEDDNKVDEKAMREYQRNRTGPVSSVGITQITGFVRSKRAEPGVPDLQFFMDTDRGRTCGDHKDVTFRAVYLISKCRGSLKLRSARPEDPPLINPNYLCDEADIQALLESERIVKRLTQTEVLKSQLVGYDSEPYKRCMHLVDKRLYWRCVIQKYTNGEHHHGGTCKMGPANDATAVVDHEFRVHGIDNVRIVDASVMPTPQNGNPIATIVMFGEKAADIIKTAWGTC